MICYKKRGLVPILGGDMMTKQVFRQYDIRGIVNEELNDKLITEIARAFAAYATGRAIGRFCRKEIIANPHHTFRDLVG